MKLLSVFAMIIFFGSAPPLASAKPLTLRFALVEDKTSAPTTVFLQGREEQREAYQKACGIDGRLCQCDFLDSNEKKIGESMPNSFFYHESGNYFRCFTSAPLAGAQNVLLRNKKSGKKSIPIEIKTHDALTLADLLEDSAQSKNVRTIFRYSCLETFLQKAGTTTTNFDCNDPGRACNGDNFCLLQSSRNFHLYSDAWSNNIGLKGSDRLYNDSSTGSICGLQILRTSCNGARGTLEAQFALMAQSSRFWNTAVSLTPAPYQNAETYGFAASVDPVMNECPPGLVKRVFFRVNPVNNSAANDSNFPANMVANEVSEPGMAPANFAINQIPGGHCNGTHCTLPNMGVMTISSQAYSSAGETVFCVIPPHLLSQSVK